MGYIPIGNIIMGNPAQKAAVTNIESEWATLSRLISLFSPELASSLSAKLLGHYGSLTRVFAAVSEPDEVLPFLNKETQEKLWLFVSCMEETLARQTFDGPILSNSRALVDYLTFHMGCRTREMFRVLFLTPSNTLILDRIMWEGTVDRVQVHPREIVRKALDLGASALICVHNHPGGKASPSQSDLSLAKKIDHLCNQFEVEVHDHLIVTEHRCFSIRQGAHLGGMTALEHADTMLERR